MDHRLKTLEFLKDWSTWLVAINTGALALASSSAGDWHDPCVKTLVAVAGAALLISLLEASWLVGGNPGDR